MPDLTTGEGQAEMDRWLAGRHAELIRDLATTLDLDTGLRDATLPAQHAALVADLGRILDLDAGLAAVLPVPAPPAVTPHPPSNAELVPPDCSRPPRRRRSRSRPRPRPESRQ